MLMRVTDEGESKKEQRDGTQSLRALVLFHQFRASVNDTEIYFL